jgi:rhamnogalacturonan endolyase
MISDFLQKGYPIAFAQVYTKKGQIKETVMKLFQWVTDSMWLAALCVGVAWSSGPVRQMERLDRGCVAIPQANGQVFVSWRMLGTEPKDLSYNVYRNGDKLNHEPITRTTNLVDDHASVNAAYTVTAIIDGTEGDPSAPVTVWTRPFLEVPLKTPDGYQPNDASVGDLDGDGDYEIVLHQTGRARDNASRGSTDPPILEAYTLEGTFLWRINLGKNIREGAHYTQFMVYDFDGDGKAEMACKTADGTVDGLDVEPFVAAVLAGGPQAIPEPSTLLLTLVALGVVGGWRKWKQRDVFTADTH